MSDGFLGVGRLGLTVGERAEQAAALLQSLVNNHALVDGNKRLGWLATGVFLELNGANLADATTNEVHDLVKSVAAGDMSVEAIAAEFRRLHGDA